MKIVALNSETKVKRNKECKDKFYVWYTCKIHIENDGKTLCGIDYKQNPKITGHSIPAVADSRVVIDCTKCKKIKGIS